MEVLFLLLLLGFIPASIAAGKGLSRGAWYVYGVSLFPIALVHALLIQPTREQREAQDLASGAYARCPECRELVRHGAKKCPHCRESLSWAEED